MAIVLGVWHLTLEGGKSHKFQAPASIRVSNVSFGEDIADPSGRSVVKLTFEPPAADESDDEDAEGEDSPEPKLATTVLCALTPGKIEQASIDLTLQEQDVYQLEVTGKNTVYLTGNYVSFNDGDDSDGEGHFFDDDDSDDDAHDLRDVSSDVEMFADELADLDSDADRFQEVTDEAEAASTKTQKRPRESDPASKDKPSKADAKSKKLKADGGNAVPVGQKEEKETKSDKKEGKKSEKKDEKKKEKEKKAGEEKGQKKDTVTKKTLPSGILIEDHGHGTGPAAKAGNKVKMRYIGKLTNGKEFDKNVAGPPFTFRLGAGEVIKGWDEGIVGMQVGGERKLTIPPKLAYGNKKTSGIPPNSTLIFDVKLLEIK